MLPSYGKVLALGNKYIRDVLDGEVVVQEKIDGSQISFGIVDDKLQMRSRGAEIHLESPEGMFKLAVESVLDRQSKLVPGFIYRGEYLNKPKHNSLCYERVPEGNIIIFDVEDDDEEFLVAANEAERIGLESVPTYFIGQVPSQEFLMEFLDKTPILGGKMIEGIVIKNYAKRTMDGALYKAKIVADDFKEIHRDNWKVTNPNKGDVIAKLIGELKTERRWEKAIEHLRDRGELQGLPQDIGPLMKEVSSDIYEEQAEAVKEILFKWAWPQISRAVTAGLPSWYKAKLLEESFDE